ncbi:hypothetical protein [Vibrio sp. D431a]|uniref:hypothetical protein n=1 Tax=Vibrio sp. D431a TaxID=2837388 RepID=UPI002553E417|nr:hypothetical protein [Vibrio sp. D431a]MDK9793720.1 hypothetical protein [Vibrio sp. D431a]
MANEINSLFSLLINVEEHIKERPSSSFNGVPDQSFLRNIKLVKAGFLHFHEKLTFSNVETKALNDFKLVELLNSCVRSADYAFNTAQEVERAQNKLDNTNPQNKEEYDEAYKLYNKVDDEKSIALNLFEESFDKLKSTLDSMIVHLRGNQTMDCEKDNQPTTIASTEKEASDYVIGVFIVMLLNNGELVNKFDKVLQGDLERVAVGECVLSNARWVNVLNLKGEVLHHHIAEC